MRQARSAVLVTLLALAMSSHAEAVRILDDPKEAAQARADIIRQARREIDLLYFLARDDRITLSMLSLLRDAKRRGVPKVRVLVDGSFHRIPKPVLAQLRDEGVQIRVYHPLDVRHPSWMFRRMHEKVIVADSSRYITGGRNLAESYFGLAGKKNYVDRDVYVEGESAREADAHFDRLWKSRHVSELRVRISPTEKLDASRRLDLAFEALEKDGFLSRESRNWSEGAETASNVTFLHDPLDPEDGTRVGDHLHEILRSARSSILIESPYFVPSRSLRGLLVEKIAEGVEITVLTNSLRSTDGLLPQAAYLRYRRGLARAGIRFHEYKGPDPLHAKSIVIDERIAMIGSYNIDPRSRYLNTEVICAIDDEALARELTASIETHMAHAWAIQHTTRGPRLSRAMTFRLWAAKLLVPLIEPQL